VPGVNKPCLVDFSVLQEYIIPRKAFCNRLITVDDPEGKYAVIGFPVSIPSPRYDRNEFIFNFGIVVECELDEDQIPYERVVRRLAVTFAEMEKQNCYLSQDPTRYHLGASAGSGDYQIYHQQMQQQVLLQQQQHAANTGGLGGGIGAGSASLAHRRPIESLLEIIKEDLNNYGECMIPVDDANTVNMKLFPYYPTPPEVKGWHVPVARMKFADVVDPTWDLTLQRVIAHIDGVSDVRRIAFNADVSLELTRLALRHLLYYDTIILLDMFFFGACYAPRPAISDFVANIDDIVDECATYVCVTGSHTHVNLNRSSSPSDHHHPLSSLGSSDKLSPSIGSRSRGRDQTDLSMSAGLSNDNTHHRISNFMLIKLMTTFCVGKTVMEWLKGHMDGGFDVLRFVDVRRLVQFGLINGLLYRVHKHVISKQYLAALATGQTRPSAGGDPLQKYTDGRHTFDEIMTEQNLTDAEIMDKLKSFPAPAGDLTVLYR